MSAIGDRPTLPEGWGWPGAARKAHYFRENESVAVCGKWMFTGQRDPETGSPSPDDCATCRRKVSALHSEGVGS